MSVHSHAPEAPGRAPRDAARAGVPLTVARFVARNPMLLVLALVAVVATATYDGFLETANLRNMLAQNAPLAFASIGMTYVIITGGFDLSVGSILAAGAVAYVSLDGHASVSVALAVALAVGVVAGGLNGLLITRLHINPFVATLGTASIITGVAAARTGSETLLVSTESFSALGSDRLLGLPIAVWIGVVLFVVAGLVLAKTTYGRWLYAVGGNAEAARLAGIPVDLARGSTYLIVGVLAALGGVILASQVGTAQANFGASLALDAIAVVIIGGTSLAGGEGAIWRTAVGLLILAIINNLFQSLALDPSLQQIMKGTIVVGAVAFDAWVRRRRQ